MESVAHDEIMNDGTHWTPDVRVRFASLSLFVGLIVGAAFWGMSADVIG